jgi:biotin-dependent carboxylase-like uncharacterized protein
VSGATLGTVALSGLVTIQDGGRRGHMHEGVPPGGALVPELLARANLAVGNRWDLPALELFGTATLSAESDGVHVATDDGVARTLRAGETWAIPASASLRVRYAAVAGGFGVPPVLGGCGTLPVASLGGLEGRAIRRGDILQVAPRSPEPEARQLPPEPDFARPIRVIPGPDRFQHAVLETFLSRLFVISPACDRVGTRLLGPPLLRGLPDNGPSAPMVTGAVQVPASGEPIVLGPDHPTTGGYPVLAVVIRADTGALFARRPGSRVRFAAVSPSEARAAWRARGF